MGDALERWQLGTRKRWRRIRIGWPDENDQALCFTTTREPGGAFVSVRSQYQGGPPSHLWYVSDRGDIHTRADYMAALVAFLQCGIHAGFIAEDDIAAVMAVIGQWSFE